MNIKKFTKDENGNFAMMFGLMMIPLTVAVGAAVDQVNLQHARSDMQAALDATVMQYATRPNLTALPPAEVVKSVYVANLSRPSLDPTVTLTRDPVTFEIKGTAQLNQNLSLMKLAGLNQQTIVVNSTATPSTIQRPIRTRFRLDGVDAGYDSQVTIVYYNAAGQEVFGPGNTTTRQRVINANKYQTCSADNKSIITTKVYDPPINGTTADFNVPANATQYKMEFKIFENMDGYRDPTEQKPVLGKDSRGKATCSMTNYGQSVTTKSYMWDGKADTLDPQYNNVVAQNGNGTFNDPWKSVINDAKANRPTPNSLRFKQFGNCNNAAGQTQKWEDNTIQNSDYDYNDFEFTLYCDSETIISQAAGSTPARYKK